MRISTSTNLCRGERDDRLTQTFGEQNLSAHRGSWSAHPVMLRPFPYPYRAAVAICSDIDETRDTEEFLEIQRFLNTKAETRMGQGLGLEIGNSFYFYDDQKHFSFFTGDERAQRVIVDLIQAGYIDCLHSFGDAARERGQIQRGLEVLERLDCKLDVWINHFNAPSDLGRKFEYFFRGCQGDNPDSELYHANRLIDYGIRYAWIGAITRVIGQSPARRKGYLSTVFNAENPVASSNSLVREIGKSALGLKGDERYTLHRSNQLTRVTPLADGRKIHEFIRYADHPRGVSYCATSPGLAYAISRHALRRLADVQGYMIVYTHLGKNQGCPQVIAPETQVALRGLEREYRAGNILVTTTSRLLNYYTAHRDLTWSARRAGGQTIIEIEHIDDPFAGRIDPKARQLQGLTFYVPRSDNATVRVRGAELKELLRNPADGSGMESVSIPIAPLEFPY